MEVTMKQQRRTHLQWQRRHDAVLRYVLEHPTAKNQQIGNATGYSRTHISRIVNSAAFNTRYQLALNILTKEIARTRAAAISQT